MTDGPLSSWNDGTAKAAIIDFVARVTKKGSADFVPPARRIAPLEFDCGLMVDARASRFLRAG